MRRENFLKLESGAADRMAGTVLGWNRLALQVVRQAQPGPAPAARALAVLHTCIYNAWAAYDDTARQTAHGAAVRLPLTERSAASKASAISHAACRVLTALFPAQLPAVDARMALLGLDPAAGGGPLSPAGIGRSQAAAMGAYCRRDGVATGGGLLAGASGNGSAGAPAVIEPAPGRWFLPAHMLSERDGYSDNQDVRLFFALANALADAGTVAMSGAAGAAAAEVIRRFTGDARFGAAGSAGQELGRQAGARAFEGARRYWDGKL